MQCESIPSRLVEGRTQVLFESLEPMLVSVLVSTQYPYAQLSTVIPAEFIVVLDR